MASGKLAPPQCSKLEFMMMAVPAAEIAGKPVGRAVGAHNYGDGPYKELGAMPSSHHVS